MESVPSRGTRFGRVVSLTFRGSLLNKGMACRPEFNFNMNLDKCFQANLSAGYSIHDSVQIIEVRDQKDNGAGISEWKNRPFLFPNRTIQT